MKRQKKKIPAKYILLVLTIFCLFIIVCSVKLSISADPFTTSVGYVIEPMQKGINAFASALGDMGSYLKSSGKIRKENEELKAKVDELTDQLSRAEAQEKELEDLKEFYNLDQSYTDYEKVAASVVAKDSGNWFSTFTIDSGSAKGVEEGMNVIAEGGLAGIVTYAGVNFSTVRSIVDDLSSVSATDEISNDLCVVSGSLESMNTESTIEFSGMRDSGGEAAEGDLLVVSNVSDRFLAGIPIGYIADISTDANNLSLSGHVVPLVDFKHLDQVFVILKVKDTDDDGGNTEEE